MIQPHMSEEDRQKIAALMIKYGEMDQRLEKQTKVGGYWFIISTNNPISDVHFGVFIQVLKELEKNVRTNQHLVRKEG